MENNIKFIDNIARKTGQSGLLEIECAKTKRAVEIANQTGLFYVPRILNFDVEKGVLDFEKLAGLRTIQQVAADNPTSIKPLMGRLGRSLAVVHEQMVLPNDMKSNLPDKWMGVGGDNVFIHGDLTGHNICFQEHKNRLVILDWSTAPVFGQGQTFGSRYFDIAWFIYFMFHHLPAKKILSWKAKAMANAFIAGYVAQNPSSLKPDMVRRFQIDVEEFKRDNFWRGCGQYLWYRQMLFYCLWLWKYYRYCNYKPQL